MVMPRVKEFGVDTLLETHGEKNRWWNTCRINFCGRHKLEVLSSEGFEVVHMVVMGSAGSGRRQRGRCGQAGCGCGGSGGSGRPLVVLSRGHRRR